MYTMIIHKQNTICYVSGGINYNFFLNIIYFELWLSVNVCLPLLPLLAVKITKLFPLKSAKNKFLVIFSINSVTLKGFDGV